LSAPGGIAFDGEGNLWAADNCLVGGQSTIYHGLGGGISKIAPNGKPISPMTFGYRGGGIDCPGFGIAVAADDKVWADSLDGKTISVFDRLTGQPLSPATGYNFGGQLGAMQGIIVTPNSDVWALDSEKDQIVYLPKGDATKGRILGRTVKGKPVDGMLQVKGPFHLAVDQSDRVWISNAGSDTVTRFPASDPTNAVQIKVGVAPHGIAIDSLGNAWVVNSFGHPGFWKKTAFIMDAIGWKIAGLFASSSSKADGQTKMWIDMYHFWVKHPHGDVSMIRPDGTVLRPFDGGKSILFPWGVSIDGNDNVWVANALGHSITELCGARSENCRPAKRPAIRFHRPGATSADYRRPSRMWSLIPPATCVWRTIGINRTKA
jgi:streptogramin lyase